MRATGAAISLRTDGRWQYGVPPTANANFAAGYSILSITSRQPDRQVLCYLKVLTFVPRTPGRRDPESMVEAELVDCIVNLPTKALSKHPNSSRLMVSEPEAKINGKFRNRARKIFFIDARSLGHLVTRHNRVI